MIDAGDAGRRRLAQKTIAHQRRLARSSSSSRRPRSWPLWIAGAFSLGTSFFITLELTKPAKPPPPAVAAMARSTVSDWRTLMAAIKSAGLTGSPNVKGTIDAITRLNDRKVWITGWASEIGGAAPLHVLVFVDGKNRLTMRTQGRHADVTGALGLADAATARNVAFRGPVACARGQKLIVVAVADSLDYGYFSPRECP